jgi:hypothetical protein
MEKKQTAVEWLEEQDNVLTMKLLEKKLTPREFVVQKSKLVKQAKQMEKEQMIKFTADWIIELKKGNKHLIGKYYNETYGGKDEN